MLLFVASCIAKDDVFLIPSPGKQQQQKNSETMNALICNGLHNRL